MIKMLENVLVNESLLLELILSLSIIVASEIELLVAMIIYGSSNWNLRVKNL